jgi:hypothetical protein
MRVWQNFVSISRTLHAVGTPMTQNKIPIAIAATMVAAMWASISVAQARTSGDTCGMLRAVPPPPGPVSADVTSERDVSDLQSFLEGQDVPHFESAARRALGISDAEFQDFASQVGNTVLDGFEPKCGWPQAKDRQDWILTFTRPLFTSDGSAAIFAMSMFWPQHGGNGAICVGRKSSSGWATKCYSTWIT